MRKSLLILILAVSSFSSRATIHIVNVWDGYFQFVDQNITIQLGDTVQWLPLGGGSPSMTHTITSTNIPSGAVAFDQIWQAPADTFFQYIPQVGGLYEYECTPHVISNDMIGSINVIGGITDINYNSTLDNNLFIYPNPSSSVLYIDGLYTKTKYKIYNILGELVLSGKTNKRIDISTLIAGDFIIELIGDKPRAIKIIKQ